MNFTFVFYVLMVSKCKEEDCERTPAFNYENEKERLYCRLHKRENMVDIKTKRCLEKHCKKQPSCNYEDEQKAIYCFEHKKENMINIKSKRCIFPNCKFLSIFNIPGETIGVYCHQHKSEIMIDVTHKKCLEENCIKRPNYNFETEKTGIYCREHSKKGMVDIIHKKCKECNITRISNVKYQGYCLRCFMYKFPNEKVTKNYKTKENHMTDFIKDKFVNETLVFDKQVGGCSKRRPDVYIDKFTHVIILEFDENQHKSEEYSSCDNKRIMELFQDFGSRPLVFIRFNPDSYILNNRRIKSCFKIHKVHGIPIIDEKSNWNDRLKFLEDTVCRWLTEVPNREITYEYLYFDN